MNDFKEIATKYLETVISWVKAHWVVLRGVASPLRANAMLRGKCAALEDVLDNLSQGIVVFDRNRAVVFCNKRYRELYDLTEADVTPGTPVRRLIQRRLELGMKVSSCPDDYVRERIESVVKPSSAVQDFADGRKVAYAIRPTADGGGVATHEDITKHEELLARLERQRALAEDQGNELRLRNLQFDMAINNMSQGLCFFDGSQRLIVCNRRYIEMYGLNPGNIYPGISLSEIVDLRFEAGSFPEMSKEDYLNWRENVVISDEPTDSVVELKNGRVFEIHHRPMPGRGWVATHEDITAQRQSADKIAHMAHHDALTGLANRVLFNERLDHAVARSARGEKIALHAFDLDHFKAVNDTLGHPAGDKLLGMVADRLQDVVREADTIARVGGDEFAIVQVGIADPLDSAALAQRIIAAVNAPYEIDGHQVVVGTSIGIAIGMGGTQSADQLVKNADLALYRAKSEGRGSFRFFEDDMDAQAQARRVLERDLRAALAKGEFELHYQPAINVASNEVIGFEALIRWNHPEKGVIPPTSFIPLAEKCGMIIQIGEWVIRTACATAVLWPEDKRIAVNLSPAQFRDAGLFHVIIRALASSGLAPCRLELEITESMLLEKDEATVAILQRLRELGVRIVLDDFGTGYSSLSYLRSFQFDKIKIDRSFIRDIAASENALTIVRALAALARGLGMTTTAEGVETQEQLDAIASEGCTEMQGFLFSKPRPNHEIEDMYFGAASGAVLPASAAA